MPFLLTHSSCLWSDPVGARRRRAWASACTDLQHLWPPHLVCSYHLGGLLYSPWAKSPPQIFGEQIWNSSLEFHHPLHNFDLQLQMRKSPLSNPLFPMNFTMMKWSMARARSATGLTDRNNKKRSASTWSWLVVLGFAHVCVFRAACVQWHALRPCVDRVQFIPPVRFLFFWKPPHS